MAADAPEFGHRLRLDTIDAVGRTLTISADEGQRASLARRFALPELSRLEAELNVRREGDNVRLTGTVHASYVQSCTATDAPVPGKITETFELLFLPETHLQATPDEEIELDNEDCDILPHDGAAIDVGEAVAQTFYLALDPYPRAKGADRELREAGVVPEDEAGPMGALAGLRDKLAGKGD